MLAGQIAAVELDAVRFEPAEMLDAAVAVGANLLVIRLLDTATR